MKKFTLFLGIFLFGLIFQIRAQIKISTENSQEAAHSSAALEIESN